MTAGVVTLLFSDLGSLLATSYDVNAVGEGGSINGGAELGSRSSKERVAGKVIYGD